MGLQGGHVDAHVAQFKFSVHWVGRVSTLQWPQDRNTGRQLTVWNWMKAVDHETVTAVAAITADIRGQCK